MQVFTLEKHVGRKKAIQYYVDEKGCWICVSHFKNKGYPQIWHKGKSINIARYLCLKHSSGENKDTLHSCDNSFCINPKHLSFGTRKQNVQEAFARGRMPVGERHSKAVLKKEDIIFIRKSNLKVKDLSLAFGVKEGYIYDVKNGRSWKYL